MSTGTHEKILPSYQYPVSKSSDFGDPLSRVPQEDVFQGDSDPQHDIQYKTLSWQVRCASSFSLSLLTSSQFVSLLMIAEIVSNGMLSLPSALAVVGKFPILVAGDALD
jgi:hypothetical protein